MLSLVTFRFGLNLSSLSLSFYSTSTKVIKCTYPLVQIADEINELNKSYGAISLEKQCTCKVTQHDACSI